MPRRVGANGPPPGARDWYRSSRDRSPHPAPAQVIRCRAPCIHENRIITVATRNPAFARVAGKRARRRPRHFSAMGGARFPRAGASGDQPVILLGRRQHRVVHLSGCVFQSSLNVFALKVGIALQDFRFGGSAGQHVHYIFHADMQAPDAGTDVALVGLNVMRPSWLMHCAEDVDRGLQAWLLLRGSAAAVSTKNKQGGEEKRARGVAGGGGTNFSQPEGCEEGGLWRNCGGDFESHFIKSRTRTAAARKKPRIGPMRGRNWSQDGCVLSAKEIFGAGGVEDGRDIAPGLN